jgi:hypothetical protein
MFNEDELITIEESIEQKTRKEAIATMIVIGCLLILFMMFWNFIDIIGGI